MHMLRVKSIAATQPDVPGIWNRAGSQRLGANAVSQAGACWKLHQDASWSMTENCMVRRTPRGHIEQQLRKRKTVRL